MGVITAAFVGLAMAPNRRVLEVKASRSGQVLLCAEVAEGEEFMLSFVHSVNRRPVYDTFEIAGDQLVIVSSRFDAFGAGMPETSGGEGKLEVDAGGWLRWSLRRPMPSVDLFVGRVANHTLHIRGRQTALADLVEPGTSVTIRTAGYSLLDAVKRSCAH